jgi:hypothetical protein
MTKVFSEDLVRISETEIKLPDGLGYRSLSVDPVLLVQLSSMVFHDAQESFLKKEMDIFQMRCTSLIGARFTEELSRYL